MAGRKKQQTIAGAIAAATGTEQSPATIYQAADIRVQRVVPSGSPNLDLAVGLPGLPSGRIFMFHGPGACGKTSKALDVGKYAGGPILYFDFESKLDKSWVRKVGVDLPNFVYYEPPHIENACELIETALSVADKTPDVPVVIIWDSIHSAMSKAVVAADWDAHNWANEARTYSNLLRKVSRIIARSNAILIGISQMRITMKGRIAVEKMGIGNAWTHQACVVLRWAKKTRGKLDVTGKKGKRAHVDWDVQISKNQFGDPDHECKLRLVYGHGYSYSYSLLHAAMELDLVELRGSRYYLEGSQLANGEKNMLSLLETDEELRSAIAEYVRDHLWEVYRGEEKEVPS